MSRKIDGASVAVVGGAGFLGSHLVDYLCEERGCRVIVLDNLVAGQRAWVNKKAKFLHIDITGSEDYLKKLFQFYQCRFVFNYAAYPYIPDSFERPLHVSNVNFAGAVKVINAAHEAGAESILQVSSAEIYGEAGTVRNAVMAGNYLEPESCKQVGFQEYGIKIDERAKVSPHSTYGASKAAVDFYVQARWRENKVPAIALRQFNCVGARETHPYVIPEIISQLARRCKGDTSGNAGVPIVKLGNNSFRDFMWAGDAVRMATELAEKGAFGEVYNLGSESGIKIYDLAKLIGKVMGFKDVHVEEAQERKRPWEIWHLQSDNSKIISAIGRSMKLTMEKAIELAVGWFNENGRRWPWEA